MQVLINALSATAGGGITYIHSLLHHLRIMRTPHRYFVFLPSSQLERAKGESACNIELLTAPSWAQSSSLRMLFEQFLLPRFVQEKCIDLCFCTGNFCLLSLSKHRSPVKQVLLCRNDLYSSSFYEQDLLKRGHRLWLLRHALQKKLVHASLRRADAVVVPTAAFGSRIKAYVSPNGAEPIAIPYGFDPDYFTQSNEPPSADLEKKLRLSENYARLLLVSHYNYYRNFETLLKAIPILKRQLSRPPLLVLTTELKEGACYGGYDATRASRLVDRLGVRGDIAMLGSVPYEKLHHLYRCCDLFVFPSYAESFGHPLLEAMAMGLPVLCSDMDVHREVCGDAALYFEVFNEHDLAQKAAALLSDAALRQTLLEKAARQVQKYSWAAHVRALLQLFESVVAA